MCTWQEATQVPLLVHRPTRCAYEKEIPLNANMEFAAVARTGEWSPSPEGYLVRPHYFEANIKSKLIKGKVVKAEQTQQACLVNDKYAHGNSLIGLTDLTLQLLQAIHIWHRISHGRRSFC